MLRNAEPLLHRLRGTDAVHGVCQVPGQRGVLIRARGWLCSVSFSGPDFRWNGTDYRHLEGLSDEFVQRTDLADELGRGMIAQTADDEFCLVGHRMRVSFHRVPPADGSVPYALISPVHQAASLPTLSLDEGRIDDDGRFVVDRPRTGDEARHGVWLAADRGVVRVRLDPRG